MGDLQQISKNINSEFRLMELNGEKDSEGYKQFKVAQKEANAEIKEMAKGIDVNDATMKQLQSSSKQLHHDLANLKIGSEEWIAKLKEVQEVDEKLAETKKQVKGFNDEVDQGKEMWGAFKQLAD